MFRLPALSVYSCDIGAYCDIDSYRGRASAHAACARHATIELYVDAFSAVVCTCSSGRVCIPVGCAASIELHRRYDAARALC